MKKHLQKHLLAALFAFGLAILLVASPFASKTSQAATTWSGATINYANVRTGPSTGYGIVTTYAPNTRVTVYASVSGQVVWGGISTWYRISSFSSVAQYIYGGLITQVSSGSGGGGTVSASGKYIVVSLSKQWLYAYENGRLVFNAAVMTGRPALPTPTGTYHIFIKQSPTWFYSPWPYGSPYWYPPTYINYAMEFKEGGYYIHDATWHSVFGPGTNGWHYDPVFGWQWGTHGCVATTVPTAQWLYGWAPIGTTVQIVS